MVRRTGGKQIKFSGLKEVNVVPMMSVIPTCIPENCVHS